MTKRVFVVENHVDFRRVVQILIAREKDLTPCGEADSAEEALDMILETSPDLVLIDLSLPGMSGTEFIKVLKDRCPKSSCVILSGHHEREYADQALEAGALGYIVKSNAEEILEGVRCSAAGERFLSREIRSRE